MHAPFTQLDDLTGADVPRLDADVITATPGRPWCLEWTAVVDTALRQHLTDFQASERGQRAGGVALIALGSYARRSLCPQSDIDLLLLHDGWRSSDLEALVQAVCYPLWDAGLSVGHAVRTTKEAVKSTAERVDTATALTERRLVAGSVGMADDLSGRMSRWLRRNGGSLAEQVVVADAERRRQHGGTPGALEPDLKDGAGGLRDLHSLRWAGAILLGQAGLDPLVGARYLGADDRVQLARAGEQLLAARCALHLVGDKSVRNILRLDLQDEVAQRLSMEDGDVLLRQVGLATRTISHLHARSWPVLIQDATRGRRRHRPVPRVVGDGLVLVDGLVEVDLETRLADDPSLGLRAVATAAVNQTVIGRRSAVALRRQVDAVADLPWDDRSRAALMKTLRAGPTGRAAMNDADYLGLWQAHLPEWERVRGRPQRNPLHTYDLDTHAMHASSWLTSVVKGTIDPEHADVFAGLDDPDAVVLATWLHDVGKAWPGDHSESGEVVAREWTVHMGFSETRADRIARLVRWHLLLPEVATQRDLEDLAEIDDVAAKVGDAETLDGLYLLSVADSRATGKAAWSEWKDLLIRRLYHAVRARLEGDVDVGAAGSAPTAMVAAAVATGADEDLVKRVLAGLPARYLRIAAPEQLAVHSRLISGSGAGLTLDVRPGPVASTTVLSVAAADRHGLFADIVGVLAAHRLEVQQARVFTHSDGTALDWFVVVEPTRGHLTPPTDWDAVQQQLRLLDREEVDVFGAVQRRERARDVKPPALVKPVAVRISTHRAGQVIRVEVHGPDSPGALFRVSQILSNLGTELQGALVATLGPEVRDTFFVTGVLPDDTDLQVLLEPALLDTPAVA